MSTQETSISIQLICLTCEIVLLLQFCPIAHRDEFAIPMEKRILKKVPSTATIASRKVINIVNLISSKFNYSSGG